MRLYKNLWRHCKGLCKAIYIRLFTKLCKDNTHTHTHSTTHTHTQQSSNIGPHRGNDQNCKKCSETISAHPNIVPSIFQACPKRVPNTSQQAPQVCRKPLRKVCSPKLPEHVAKTFQTWFNQLPNMFQQLPIHSSTNMCWGNSKVVRWILVSWRVGKYAGDL